MARTGLAAIVCLGPVPVPQETANEEQNRSQDTAISFVDQEKDRYGHDPREFRRHSPRLARQGRPLLKTDPGTTELPLVTISTSAGMMMGELAMFKAGLNPKKMVVVEDDEAARAVIRKLFPEAVCYSSFES